MFSKIIFIKIGSVNFFKDYFPFGMEMPNFGYKAEEYRYGFNGMEKDNEMKGKGNSYDYGARMYDPRVGRFFSVDPMREKFPDLSPYIYANNNPVHLIDKEGTHAMVSFNGNNVTIKCEIRIYGKYANQENINKIADQINNAWGGTHKYKAGDGQIYNVKIKAIVRPYDTRNSKINERGPLQNKYEKDNKALPVSTRRWDEAPDVNFVKLTDNVTELHDNDHGKFTSLSSFVQGGKTGSWFKNINCSGSDDAAHEFGHLIGLPDNYEMLEKIPDWYMGDRSIFQKQIDQTGVCKFPIFVTADIMFDGSNSVTQGTINNLMRNIFEKRNDPDVKNKNEFLLPGAGNDDDK